MSAAGSDGTAETTWRLGQQSGSQLATARLPESGGETWFRAKAKPGGAKVIAVTPSTATLGVGDQTTISAVVIDKFGNPAGGNVKWSTSNPKGHSVKPPCAAAAVAVNSEAQRLMKKR